MISQLAKEDLQDLRDAGLKPTDEDVIRLHALARILEDGPETTAANAPRFAIAGGIVFWEPTCAAWEWYKYAKSFAADTAMDEWMFAYACAKGRERGHLTALVDPIEIEKEIGRFIGSINATKDEVVRAITYAAVGGDDADPEETDLAKAKEDEKRRITANYSAMEERIRQAAAATGLTFEDIMIQTPSRLDGMIYAAYVQAGMTMTRTAARSHADYLATLHAIRRRLTEEKEASEKAS